MAEQLHQEIFKKLKESVPGLQWDFRENDEVGALITACFVVCRFDGTQETHPVAHLSIIKRRDKGWRYSVGFMQIRESFVTHETAITWLLSKFRQFAVEEGRVKQWLNN